MGSKIIVIEQEEDWKEIAIASTIGILILVSIVYAIFCWLWEFYAAHWIVIDAIIAGFAAWLFAQKHKIIGSFILVLLALLSVGLFQTYKSSRVLTNEGACSNVELVQPPDPLSN